MRRAGIYIRKSNEPGETNHSLEVQRQTCVEIAERAGYEVHDTYRQVVSGWDPKADRSEMRRLISDVQAGHVSVIVVVREDRLGRRLSETARLLEICREAGCLIHTSTGVLDPSNASQALLYNIV
ncbi:MAG: recombinase family protein, partial [Nesterenkonia sp.]